MKSLLIFVPNKLFKGKPGYLFGKVLYDENTGVKKVYVIGISKTENLETIKCSTNIIGYYSGVEQKRGYVDKKCADWIPTFLRSGTSKEDDYDYGIKSITIYNKKISTLNCHTVFIIYDQTALRETELLQQKAVSGDHFYELMKIVQNKQVEEVLQKKGKFTYIKETLLVYLMFLYFYPVLLLNKITHKLLPIFKYSSLGLHIHGWLENVKWMLIAVIQNKRFTLKTGNYVFALIIDMLLGIFILQLLLHYLENTFPSEILLNNAEKVVTLLKDLINWLMGAPAGLKLNLALNNMLGKFFLYHIHLWWTFLIFIKPLMDFAFVVLVLLGRLGVTFQIAIAADLLALVSFHAYCIYVYATRLFNIQLKGITGLVRLFLGKKKNPLRERVDSCQYQPDQLFVGTLLFTILLFLMPTTWVYYAVFTMLRLALIGFGGFLTRLKFYLQVMPVYTFFKWFLQSYSTRSIVNIKLHSHRADGPIILIMSMVVAPWQHTWKKCMPDTIAQHPPIEWNKIVNNIIWGELLYPFFLLLFFDTIKKLLHFWIHVISNFFVDIIFLSKPLAGHVAASEVENFIGLLESSSSSFMSLVVDLEVRACTSNSSLSSYKIQIEKCMRWDLMAHAPDNNVDQIQESNEQKVIQRRRRKRKQKSNSSHNGTNNEENDGEENNFVGAQTNKNEQDSNDEVIFPKKHQRSAVTNAESDPDNIEAEESEVKKPKQPSKRQLKREKAEKKENEKREAHRLDAMKKGLTYVSKWKHARSEWKFEKLRQIWLIDNLLDETCIPDNIFPTVLEYFEGCKGMAREQLLKKGMDVIKKIEENEENKDEMETVAYQRARQLLQALPTET
ncbi:phosphatidylinositol glycan anchor biosynthesis class Q [Halictus rubicundus]|uniref:phosphatidylinositol glycan anchor biosynthesis class Q n=1 Tax=Halictus rubicundus TaxID=77578 RepID=UPI004036E8D7